MVLRVLLCIGMIPLESAQAIEEKGKDIIFDADRIDEIEREVKHDVIAFLTHVAEKIGDDARFLHQGMTSSDVLDTAFNVQPGNEMYKPENERIVVW